MPPRPRPKPRKKAADITGASTSVATTSGSTTTSGSGAASSSTPQEDEDEYFFRNRNRSNATWRNLDQATREAPKRASPDPDDDHSDSIGGSPRKKHKRKQRDTGSIPDWEHKLQLLSEDVDSDHGRRRGGKDSDDDDVEVLGGSKSQDRRRRGRSRSKSITPPPEITAGQLFSIKQIVKTALGADAQSTSSHVAVLDIDDDEDEFSFTLDPELQQIARQSKLQNRNKIKRVYSREASESYEERPGADEEIRMSIKWVPHPQDPNGVKAKEWDKKMLRSDNFRVLFEAIADEVSTVADTLIVTVDRQRIFPSTTPLALNLRFSAKLEACDKVTYDYIRAQRDKTPSFESPLASPSRASPEPTGEKLKLTLRTAKPGVKDVTLTVRTTTTCGAVVQAFVKAAGLVGKVKVENGRVSVDGDKLDNDVAMGDADVEDGDMVEVVGL